MSTGVERERRIAQNEVLFRAVNEQVKALDKTFTVHPETMEIVCECGGVACVNHLKISAAEYEHIRSNPTWFAIIPGHEMADVEDVIASHPGYDIVKKHPGEATLIVKETDPRD